jgi:hypothetical protein
MGAQALVIFNAIAPHLTQDAPKAACPTAVGLMSYEPLASG